MDYRLLVSAMAELEDRDLDRMEREIQIERQRRYRARIDAARQEAYELATARGLTVFDALPPRLQRQVQERSLGLNGKSHAAPAGD